MSSVWFSADLLQLRLFSVICGNNIYISKISDREINHKFDMAFVFSYSMMTLLSVVEPTTHSGIFKFPLYHSEFEFISYLLQVSINIFETATTDATL